MPRTAITVQELSANVGAVISLAAADAANDMKFFNDGNTTLIIKNAGVATATATVLSVAESKFGRKGDLTVTVPAGKESIVNDLAPSGYNVKSGTDQDTVQVDFDIDTTVTVGAVKRKK